VIRALIAVLLTCAVTSCATRHASTTQAVPACFRMKVVVTAEDGNGRLAAPGVPVDIVVRSKQGHVLAAVISDSAGKAALEVCWRDDDPPWQVEAQLRFGQQFVGTLASFLNNSETYCLTLPSRIGGDCGTWRTGPN
jgi:hypothetical protein